MLTLVQVEVVGLNQGLGLVLAGRLKETKIFRDAYTSSTLSEFFLYLLCICVPFVSVFIITNMDTWSAN